MDAGQRLSLRAAYLKINSTVNFRGKCIQYSCPALERLETAWSVLRFVEVQCASLQMNLHHGPLSRQPWSFKGELTSFLAHRGSLERVELDR